MTRVRLGAVEYLNARPLVYGLDRSPRFSLRYDVPSKCAALLHEASIDVGLIPSIEYLRSPSAGDYRIVPNLAIASRGPVASVALYTTKAIADVRSIAMDTSSRTSVALVRVLCARAFRIQPDIQAERPHLETMLSGRDAALVIGDNALFQPAGDLVVAGRRVAVEKIDLGEIWTNMTGLPFVYAFWAGRTGALTDEDIHALQEAKAAGTARPDEIGRAYVEDPERQAIAARYLRDNIKYHLGPDERAGLELFYRYASEAGVASVAGSTGGLRFY